MTTEAVAAFGTGLLRTTVRRTPDGFLWSRRTGPLAPSPFAPLAPGLAESLAGQECLQTRWLLGESDRRGNRHYAARGRLTAAYSLLTRDGFREFAPSPELLDALTGLGGLLAGLHRTRVPPTAPSPGPSRALCRLHGWLTGASEVSGADLLLSGLGARLFAVLTRGCAAALTPSPNDVLCHGAPGLGSLLLGGPGRPAEMLIGEDVCRAPAAYDLGWPTGELIELRRSHGAREPEAWQPLMDAVGHGYGDTGASSDSLWPALRIAVHAHDTIAYRPWPPARAIPEFLPLLHDLLHASVLPLPFR
ncbi:phosphotransferase [Streptomyces sp. MMS24-I29]|uniref:phosphotransferase n=1 Tax=Streptomyces sp. MMS24-I29 TaxID=3351480 RepID=UPI003C7CA554